jgi:hypothetical protein
VQTKEVRRLELQMRMLWSIRDSCIELVIVSVGLVLRALSFL